MDLALDRPLSRSCEVPELKHACLGGVYALKGALRFAALDGKGRKAIVVTADIAEYARGSTGEPTQGAGAVALLVERNKNRTTELGPSHFNWQPDGRQVLTWQTDRPRINELYTIKWQW